MTWFMVSYLLKVIRPRLSHMQLLLTEQETIWEEDRGCPRMDGSDPQTHVHTHLLWESRNCRSKLHSSDWPSSTRKAALLKPEGINLISVSWWAHNTKTFRYSTIYHEIRLRFTMLRSSRILQSTRLFALL